MKTRNVLTIAALLLACPAIASAQEYDPMYTDAAVATGTEAGEISVGAAYGQEAGDSFGNLATGAQIVFAQDANGVETAVIGAALDGVCTACGLLAPTDLGPASFDDHPGSEQYTQPYYPMDLGGGMTAEPVGADEDMYPGIENEWDQNQTYVPADDLSSYYGTDDGSDYETGTWTDSDW
jgi:hypothetical protein